MPGSASHCPSCGHVFWTIAPEAKKLYDLLVDVAKIDEPITTSEIMQYVEAGQTDLSGDVTFPRLNTWLNILKGMGLVRKGRTVKNSVGTGWAFQWHLVRNDA